MESKNKLKQIEIMKKAILGLVAVLIFASCEKEELFIDCGCVKTIHTNNFENSGGKKKSKVISVIDVECQEEYIDKTYELTVKVECNK